MASNAVITFPMFPGLSTFFTQPRFSCNHGKYDRNTITLTVVEGGENDYGIDTEIDNEKDKYYTYYNDNNDDKDNDNDHLHCAAITIAEFLIFAEK